MPLRGAGRATLAAAVVAVLLAPQAVLSRRSSGESFAAEAHQHSQGVEAFAGKEAQAEARTSARFAEAFAEVHEGAASTCPYGDPAAALVGGNISFNCHFYSSGTGSTCPALQAQRIMMARNYIAGSYKDYMDAAKDFQLRPLFEKSAKVLGDENYEQMLRYHVDGLAHPDIGVIEDKIKLKALAEEIGVPSTTMIFGAHKADWRREVFGAKMNELCANGVDEFMVKATHLSWSKGMKIVRGWQQKCKDEAEITKLADFVEEDIMNQLASECDVHLREYLLPGVTVEELFRTGGTSALPLEAKVQVIWGKVHQIFINGQDNRGCNIKSGAWNIYGDKNGWDLDGPMAESTDVSSKKFMDKFYDKVVAYAEKFATSIGADYTRVDFFIGGLGEDEEPVIKLNEAETASGFKYPHERFGIGSVWRDGYVTSGRVQMNTAKWELVMKRMQHDRDLSGLDEGL